MAGIGFNLALPVLRALMMDLAPASQGGDPLDRRAPLLRVDDLDGDGAEQSGSGGADARFPEIDISDLELPEEVSKTLSPSAELDAAVDGLVDRAAPLLRSYANEAGRLPPALRLKGLGTVRVVPDEEAHGPFRPSVAGKVAVITGGAQGFGAAIARGLAAAGARLVLADLNRPGAEAMAQELNREYRRDSAVGLEVDVTKEDSVAALTARITEMFGGIDLFISNAGVLKAASVKEFDLREFSFVTSVNYTGFFLCAKHSSRLFTVQNRARRRSGDLPFFADLIEINSKSGLDGSNKNAAYAGSKFGGIGLVQSFAKELVEDNVKVNAVCPGNYFDGPLWSDPEKGLFVQYLNTGKVPGAQSIAEVKRFYESKVPMGRGCTGPDVVKAILYAVGQRYETGQAIPVTGGQVMLS